MSSNAEFWADHIWHVERDADGWPTGLTEEEKDKIREAVRRSLTQYGPQPIHSIERTVAHTTGTKFDHWCLWDARYAAVHRACQQIGATVVIKL